MTRLSLSNNSLSQTRVKQIFVTEWLESNGLSVSDILRSDINSVNPSLTKTKTKPPLTFRGNEKGLMPLLKTFKEQKMALAQRG